MKVLNVWYVTYFRINTSIWHRSASFKNLNDANIHCFESLGRQFGYENTKIEVEVY